MSQTSKLVFLDISLVRILYAHHVSVQYFSLMCKDSFTRCIANTVLLPVTVVLSIGYGGSAPMHI